jgi:uridine phosphorylase
MYKEGIEVKRTTEIGILIEKASWFAVLEDMFPGAERIYYPNDQDEVLHIVKNGVDIAFIAGQGSSMAACMAERLRVYGAKVIIRVGTCGALSSRVKLWTPIITTACVSDEGTSPHYLPHGFPIISDTNLNNVIAGCFQKLSLDYQIGVGITTDGRWREKPEWLQMMSQYGAMSIEMETAAILAVGIYRHIPVAAINIPADSPAAEGSTETDFKGIPDRTTYNGNLEKALNAIVSVVVNAALVYLGK